MIRLQGVASADVELGGVLYSIIPPTKSVIDRMEAAQGQLQDAETADDLVAAYGEMFDAQLVPVDENKRASATVRALWDADEVAFSQLERLRLDVAAATRPT